MRRVCHPQNFFTKVSEKVSPTLVARDMVEGSRLDHQIQSLGLRSLGGGEQHRANGTPGDTMSPSTNNSLFSVGDGEGLLFFRPGSSNSTTTKADAHREQLDDEGRQLLILYKWLDTLPLPSIKRSSGIVARDFSDGTAVADIIRYYFPTYVEQHNYVKTSNSSRKKANWEVLITKVLLKRAPFKRAFGGLASSRVRAADIEALCAGGDGAGREEYGVGGVSMEVDAVLSGRGWRRGWRLGDDDDDDDDDDDGEAGLEGFGQRQCGRP